MNDMEELKIVQDERVEPKFQAYPEKIRVRLTYLRELIVETAKESENIQEIEETLKWGELSYLAKKGSTIRIDWKAKSPNQYAMYFKCTSKLVSTFKEVYGDLFVYETNRAIVFQLGEEIPVKELKACIHMALNYHSLKHLPRLGMPNK